MFKVKFKIFHKGCWGSEINLKFPLLKFSSIDCRWIENKVVHILFAKGDSKYFKEITQYLTKRKDVTRVETLSETKDELYLRVLTKDVKQIGHFSNVFFNHGCFPVAPVKFEKEFEIWELGTSDQRNIMKLYSILKKKHKVIMSSLKEESVKGNLTQKQREALVYARHFGYFSWPRKKTVSEICEILDVPKTVFLSHLRKAENKVVKRYLSE